MVFAQYNLDDYLIKREKILLEEELISVGGVISLNNNEKRVNRILMDYKNQEIERGLNNISEFLPAFDFLKVSHEIEKRHIFDLLRKFPKGAAFQGRHAGLVSVEYIVKNLTYRDNLNGLFSKNDTKYSNVIKLKFFDDSDDMKEDYKNNTKLKSRKEAGVIILQPKDNLHIKFNDGKIKLKYVDNPDRSGWTSINDLHECIEKKIHNTVEYSGIDETQTEEYDDFVWKTIQNVRANFDEEDDYIEWMTKQLTFPSELDNLYEKMIPMLTYEPVWKDHFYQVLLEFYEDNIMYIEFRTHLTPVYYLNGTVLNEAEVCGLYIKVLNEFKQDHPKFFGAKLIYAPYKLNSNETIESYINIAYTLKEAYPDFIAGFDLTFVEEHLANLAESILELGSKMNLFVSVSETQPDADLILLDGILLDTKRINRITHHHPQIGHLIKKHKIGIEVSPISDQILSSVNDLRNHPLSYMILENYPVTIDSDTPGLWGAKGVSYDWYATFIGIASKKQDLRLLKKLALNSIEQSSLSEDDKEKLYENWKISWNEYIDNVIENEEF